MTAQASAIYSGTVSHARRGPRAHAFSYRMYMLYLDLDELPGLGLRSFRRSNLLSINLNLYHQILLSCH